MYSKKILNKDEKIRILLDSNSFNMLLDKNIDKAKLILEYSYKDPFIFYRSPKKTVHVELKEVSEFNLKYDESNNIKSINYKTKDDNGLLYFRKKTKDIIEYAEYFLKRSELKDSEIELMKMIFILAEFSRIDREIPYVLITTDKNFLNNRIKLDSDFTLSEVNILDINEAIEIMSLYSKFQNLYYIRHNYKVNKGYWYDLAFRKYIPNYSFDDINLRSFSIRLVYLLMSVDEMGYQYYLGVNNDTHETMMYHFNYFISLVSGIFDSLALTTKNKYKIKFKGDHIASRISLNKKSGKEFLKKVKEKNSELRQHISSFSNYINLIYKIRELVIHREMFEYLTVCNKRSNGEWEGNFLKLNIEIYKLFKNLKEKKIKYEGINDWGLYEKLIDFKCVDMYLFAKRALEEIIIFSKKYLSLLGYSKVKSEEIPKWLKSSVEIFDKHALCYYS